MTDMKQCKLQKGDTVQTSWIPTKFAEVGKVLRLKDDDGWEVLSVGGTLSKEMVKSQEKRNRNKNNFSSTSV